MNVVVVPHDLAIGGSQINAIDLAAAVRDLGHDVTVHGVPGPAVAHAERLGLAFVGAPDQPYRPAPQRMVHLARLVRSTGADLVHAYEWPPCLDAYFGTHLLRATPLVCTVLSMHVPTLVPRSVPLVVGTTALADEARRLGCRRVSVLEPPIDTRHDRPRDPGAAAAVRARFGIGAHETLVVTVSRLAIDLKLDALERLIDAVGELGVVRWVRLLVVGGGEAERALRRRAEALNHRAGRPVVVFAGEQIDPRPYYEAADVVVGMGSSALRAMAFGRPVVVQGEAGFVRLVEPAGIDWFLHHGFWGVGDGSPGSGELRRVIGGLLDDEARRRELGGFGRSVVLDRFDLRVAAERLLGVYATAACRRRPAPTELVANAARAGWAELRLHDPARRRRRTSDIDRRLHRAAGPVPEEVAP